MEKSFEDTFEILKILHLAKSRVYKNSWKRRGEVLGILANIARKYDRIELISLEESQETPDETRMDTLADLAVYAAKYLTYLAEHYESIFLQFIQQYPPIESIKSYCYNEGFDSVVHILTRRYHATTVLNSMITLEQCVEKINYNFELLENILIHGDWRSHDPSKCTAASDLSISAVQAILLLAKANPTQFAKLREYALSINI